MTTVEARVAGSMVGMAVGDALAMPVHWFYDPANIRKEYGSITKMVAPKQTHVESMLAGMSYDGSIDILHDKAPYYEGGRATKVTGEAERRAKSDTHGNFVGKTADERVHYHFSLLKGQNTATVAIARLATRYLVAQGGKDTYRPASYLEALRKYMTTPPPRDDDDSLGDPGQILAHGDAYLDIWVRRFFAHASRGVPLTHSAADQRDSWSIGSLDGVVMALPVIAAYRDDAESIVVARAIEHAALSHRSVTVAAAINVVAPLLLGLWKNDDDKPFETLLDEAMAKLKPPEITGPEMRASYASHRGPGNIPPDEKWRQHMVPDARWETLKHLVHAWPRDVDLDDVAGFATNPNKKNAAGRFSTACYCEHALAIVLYLAYRFPDDPRAALRANAELGGHSTARGALLGAIMGAKHGVLGLPQDWIADLADPTQVVDREAKALAAAPVSYRHDCEPL